MNPSHFKLTFLFLFINLSISFAQVKKNPMLDGKKLYTEICSGCHQEDGGGVMNLNPPLTQTSYVLGNKSELIKIILKGLNGKVNIQGKYYSNIMASQAYLKDEQIAAILTYVRSNFGNKASAISPQDVKEARTHL